MKRPGEEGNQEPEAKKPKTTAADSDDDISGLSDSDNEGPLKAKGFMAALQAADMSDDESSSSESSDDEAAKPKKPAETSTALVVQTGDAEKTAEGGEPPAPAADSDSEDDSDSSSSSSSSSESSDEEEDFGPDVLMPKPEDEEVETKLQESAAQLRRNELQVVRDVHLTRDEVIKMLTSLPEDISERGIVHSFLRLNMAVDARGGGAVEDGMCIFAECVGVERCPPYSALKADGSTVTIDFTLKCRRGSSTRPFKVCHISNQGVMEAEYDQWKTYMGKLGMDPEYNLARMKAQLENIKAARHYVFTELAVSELLKKRPSMEFEAQKESRMKSLVQAAVSQMDITSFRDNDVEEVVEKYNTTLRNLQLVEENTFQVQTDWFDSRSNLYSLKEINLKNLGRQSARDHHALMYTYEQEASATVTLNPFQRRDCRPLCAWDTKLTTDETLGAPMQKANVTDEAAAQSEPKNAAQGSAAASSSAAAPPADAAAEGSSSSGTAKEQPKVSALDAMMKAHRKCNLLAKLNLRK